MAVLKTLAGISYRFFGSKIRWRGSHFGKRSAHEKRQRQRNQESCCGIARGVACGAHGVSGEGKGGYAAAGPPQSGAARVAVGGGPERGCPRGTGWKSNPGGTFWRKKT